jgi:hypothetical protein
MGDDAITTVNRVKDRAPPVRHGAASRYVNKFPEPLAARADIDITAHRSDALIIIAAARLYDAFGRSQPLCRRAETYFTHVDPQPASYLV